MRSSGKAQLSKTLPMVFVDEVPNCVNMIRKFLGERERFSREPTAALADRAVQPFDQTGWATDLIDGLAPFGWQDDEIDLIEVREADRALTVFGWEGEPAFLRGSLVAGANGTAHHHASIRIVDSLASLSLPQPLPVLHFTHTTMPASLPTTSIPIGCGVVSWQPIAVCLDEIIDQ
jgi:hypothetical protein